MTMRKRFLSGVLASVMMAGLLVTGASAAGFSRSKTYTDETFTDVSSSDWYNPSVKDCYELGLMSGSSATTFDPNGMYTIAEALTVAARMHSIYNGGDGTVPAASGEWYQPYVNYCIQNGIIKSSQFDSYTRSATRAEMAGIMAAALPDSAWAAKNQVSQLPDVSASTDYHEAIFQLYNAGIFAGSDEYGMFQPYAFITRAEVAAIVARCAVDSQRLTLNLTPLSQREAPEVPVLWDSSYMKMSSGLMRIQDSETNLWGYIDGTGAVKIAAQYDSAEPFNAYGYAVVTSNYSSGLINTSGTLVVPCSYFSFFDLGSGAFAAQMGYRGRYCLVVNGEIKSDSIYSSIYSNGFYYFCELTADNWDVYDIEGSKIGQLDGQPDCKAGNPLVAVKSDGKWALAVGNRIITDYLYDSINLYENSSLAVLNYGTQQALAGENGIIFNLGEYVYEKALYGQGIVGGYAIVRDANDGWQYALADATGLVSEFVTKVNAWNTPWLDARYINDGIIMFNEYYNGWTWVIDTNTGKAYPTIESNSSFVMLEDGTFYLGDGTKCTNAVDKGDDYCTFRVDGKYGFAYQGVTVSQPIYDTEEEAIAAYGYYKIDWENGKPVVVFGNPVGGFNEYGIQYYKNNIYYDLIVEVGEGYYICRFGNSTWYLVHT